MKKIKTLYSVMVSLNMLDPFLNIVVSSNKISSSIKSLNFIIILGKIKFTKCRFYLAYFRFHQLKPMNYVGKQVYNVILTRNYL